MNRGSDISKWNDPNEKKYIHKVNGKEGMLIDV